MLTAGGINQLHELKDGNGYISQSDLRLHFGLGGKNRIAKIEIRWPNGKTEELKGLAADAIYTLVEGSGIKDTGQLPPISEPMTTKAK